MRAKLLLSLLLGLVIATGLQAQLMPGKIKVFQVKGAVKFIDNTTGESAPLKRGQTLGQGYSIVTGPDSRCLMLFSNGASINLDQKSSLVIDTFEQANYDRSKGSFLTLKQDPSKSETLMYLDYGELVGKVKTLTQDSLFDIQAPVGTASVRGTTFLVGFFQEVQNDDYLMKVGNLEGRVAITTNMPSNVTISDAGVGDAEMDPTNTLSTGDIPEQTIVFITAKADLVRDRIYNPNEVPRKQKNQSYQEAVNEIPAEDIPEEAIPIPGREDEQPNDPELGDDGSDPDGPDFDPDDDDPGTEIPDDDPSEAGLP